MNSNNSMLETLDTMVLMIVNMATIGQPSILEQYFPRHQHGSDFTSNPPMLTDEFLRQPSSFIQRSPEVPPLFNTGQHMPIKSKVQSSVNPYANNSAPKTQNVLHEQQPVPVRYTPQNLIVQLISQQIRNTLPPTTIQEYEGDPLHEQNYDI